MPAAHALHWNQHDLPAAIEEDRKRVLFMVAAEAGVTISIDGGAAFSVPDGQLFQPEWPPLQSIEITGTGTAFVG